MKLVSLLVVEIYLLVREVMGWTLSRESRQSFFVMFPQFLLVNARIIQNQYIIHRCVRHRAERCCYISKKLFS
jgi:hypothetical protein